METFGRCTLCGGNAGRFIDGVHTLCSARAAVGLPTPNLGERCASCNGAGTQGKGGVALFLDEGPARIARSIAAQFPPCLSCAGRGYLEGDELLRVLSAVSAEHAGTVPFEPTVIRLGPKDVTVMNRQRGGWSSSGYSYPSLLDAARHWRFVFVEFGSDEHSTFVRVEPLRGK